MYMHVPKQTKYYDLTTIRLRHQSFDIRFEDEPRVRTPIRQNLHTNLVKSVLIYYSVILVNYI